MFKRKRGYIENMNKNIERMISSYIDDDISSEEKIIFEDYMKNNPDFSLKIDNMKNMVKLFNKTPKLETSSNFLYNLEQNITQKSKLNYWFTPNFKKSFVFSFALLALLAMMFNDYNIKEDVIVEKDLNNQSLVKIDADTLKNDNFPIKQVKGKVNK